MFQLHDKFFQSYVECMLWSTSNDDGTSLDEDADVSDIDSKDLNNMRSDCEDFLAGCEHLIIEDNLNNTPKDSVYTQAGHDFCLTRNGHGAGFWDGGWKEPAASILTQKSKEYGTFDLDIYGVIKQCDICGNKFDLSLMGFCEHCKCSCCENLIEQCVCGDASAALVETKEISNIKDIDAYLKKQRDDIFRSMF